ncbi:MAG: hypothetical protein AAB492_03770 [Patescibacteria group bacterium]
MQNLKQKIKETALFSDEDKIAILAAVDTYSEEDTKALETIIDEFDGKYKASISEYKKSVYEVLDQIVGKAKLQEKKRMETAASTIKAGVDGILS